MSIIRRITNNLVYFTRSKHGDSAGYEPTDTRSAEHAASVERITDYITALAIHHAAVGTSKDKVSFAKAQAVRILEECKRLEERLRSCKGADGSAAQDAQKEITLPGGLQLRFDLYCMQCAFQCWDCPKCQQVRCACSRCTCVLDPS